MPDERLAAAPRLHLVVNPSSGRGRAARLLPRVLDQLRAGIRGVELEVRYSTSYAHAQQLAHDAVAACRPAPAGGRSDALLVMGGDGMAHLGLNACATTGVPLGVLPAGTGNDFCRGVGLPTKVGLAVRSVVRGSTSAIDLTELLEVGDATGSQRSRGFVGSVLSTGYDARVNRRTNTLPASLGPATSLAYAGVALAELATFTPRSYRLVIDGEARELPAMLVAVANAGYFGGGMHVCPDARVDDGLLDVAIAHPMSRGALLQLLPQIFAGRHTSHPCVEMVRARRVRVDGDDLFAMGDGEPVGDVPVEAVVRPGALQLFRPAP